MYFWSKVLSPLEAYCVKPGSRGAAGAITSKASAAQCRAGKKNIIYDSLQTINPGLLSVSLHVHLVPFLSQMENQMKARVLIIGQGSLPENPVLYLVGGHKSN